MTLVTEFGVAALALCALGLMGGFSIAPFRGRYTVLATPLAGIAIHTIGVSLLYGILKLPFNLAAIITVTVGSLLTIITIFIWRPPAFAIAGIIFAVPTTLGSVAICTAATLSHGSPAITFLDGTDHAGYAHLADWVIAHPITAEPVASADLPYQSWPELMFRYDARFGTVVFLASVALLRGTSGLFAYDSACALALSAGVLAVGGVFARKPATLAFMLIGLSTSHWFDYSRGGYLGKLLAYPLALMLIGLFVSSADRRIAGLSLIVLAAGVTGLHPAIALLLGVTLGPYLIQCALFSNKWRELPQQRDLLQQGALLATICLVLLSGTGTISRPVGLGYPDWHVNWQYALPRIIDLENQGARISGLSESMIAAMLMFSAAVMGVLLAVAIWRRHAVAIGLLIGPAALLTVLGAINNTAISFQLIGTFYPLTLCATTCLADDAGLRRAHKALWYAVIALMIIFVATRMPRLLGAIDRYAINAPSFSRYSATEIDQLSSTIGEAVVCVDVATPQPGLILLVEFGRRGIRVQWSEGSWDLLFRYRHWPSPEYDVAAEYVLTRNATEGKYILIPECVACRCGHGRDGRE